MFIMTTLEALDCKSEAHHKECQPRCPWDFPGQMERLLAAEQALHLPRKQTRCSGATQWDTDCVKMSSLVAAESRPVIEPPHEPAGSLGLSDIYGNFEFYDDVSQ